MGKLNRTGAFLLVSALCVLVGIVLIFQHDEDRRAELKMRARKTRETMDAATSVLSGLKDAETGQRGFLLTQDPGYLSPYGKGSTEARKELRRLQSLSKEQPEIQQTVSALSAEVDKKLSELEETVRLTESRQHASALKRVLEGEGRRRMESARDLELQIESLENQRTGAYGTDIDQAAAQSRRNVLIGCSVLFLLVAAGTLLLAREVTRERALAADLEDSEQRYRNLAESLDEQVKARTQELVELNKELEAFSFSVSHDLRAPLRSIDGFSLIMLEDYGEQLDETGQGLLRRIRLATTRMGLLIKSLLELSRVHKVEMHRERVSLSSMAKGIIEDFREQEPERKVEVEIAPEIEVTADAGLLHVVLENLISNAWKFTAKKEVAKITVSTIADSGRTIYSVGDNGVGFDPGAAERLYTPFQRLHAASDFDGIGIGLATVKRVIHRHGGELWAESKPGQGATFFFTVA